MDDIREAALELIESIRNLTIAEIMKEDMIQDIMAVEKVLCENDDKNKVHQIVAGLNGSMIAFLDFSKLMKPYEKWKKAVGAVLFK
ncbi:hypothetical protein [Azotosporobacter soli]|uniref:hypothetical protein n=1 Tax=Azotosporobacter soli TaxID=3055040 RepID=UPI0031FF3EE8